MAKKANNAGEETATADTSKSCDGVAALKVFTTAELMENILPRLTIRELFGVRRAHRTFNDTIDGSKKLQSKMFLPVGDSEDDGDFTTDGDPRLNPLLYEFVFCNDNGRRFEFQEYTTELARSRQRGPLSLNRSLKLWYYNHKVDPRGRAMRREAGGKFASAEESWRRTLATKANAATVEAEVRLGLDKIASGTFDETVTLGDLVQIPERDAGDEGESFV